MKKFMTFTFAFWCICMSLTPVKAQTLQPEDIKAQFLNDWQRAKAYTDKYLNAMPADKYDSRAVDSIRSFAEQMLHLASGIFNLVSTATGKPNPYPGYNMEKSPNAQGKDSVVYYVRSSYDFAITAIQFMDASKLGEIVKRGVFGETRFSWLLKAFEHQTHHRGQCTIYIRLQGIRPPNEQLF